MHNDGTAVVFAKPKQRVALARSGTLVELPVLRLPSSFDEGSQQPRPEALSVSTALWAISGVVQLADTLTESTGRAGWA